MPDTHDDGSGEVLADRIGRIADDLGGVLGSLSGLHGGVRARRAVAAAVPALRSAADDLREQLAAATARAEKAEARIAELGEPIVEWAVRGYRDLLDRPIDIPMPEDTARQGIAEDWSVGHTRLSLLTRTAYREPPWRPAALTADAEQGGLSATETDDGASRESVDGNTSSILPQGLSEPEPERDPSAWCWAPNPHTLLHCGLLRNHEPPHLRGERTWTDDNTTEQR